MCLRTGDDQLARDVQMMLVKIFCDCAVEHIHADLCATALFLLVAIDTLSVFRVQAGKAAGQ